MGAIVIDIVEFCEDILNIELAPYQKRILEYIKNNPNKRIIYTGRRAGMNTINKVLLKHMEYINKGGDSN